MKKVTGIGGIFFKTQDPAGLKKWYSQNLGFETDDYGHMFKSRDFDDPDETTFLQWSPFKEDTDYFGPSSKPYMINYRVADLEALKKELETAGVEIVDDIESYEYGKFLHIMDPEGNKIELWEPPAGGGF